MELIRVRAQKVVSNPTFSLQVPVVLSVPSVVPPCPITEIQLLDLQTKPEVEAGGEEVLLRIDSLWRFRFRCTDRDVSGEQEIRFALPLRVPGGLAGRTVDVSVLSATVSEVTLSTSTPRVFTFPGHAPGEQFGYSVADLGVWPGIGPVFASGAPSAAPAGRTDAGSVYLIRWDDGTLLRRVDGQEEEAEFGFSLALVGDVNGDGVPDLAVGAPSANPAGNPKAGSVFLLSGADGSTLWRLDGTVAWEQFGWTVAGTGDLNGDGIGDLAVGAPSADPGGLKDAGSLFLYSGADGSLIDRLDGSAAGDAFGFSVSAIGDVDGDGVADLAVGAIGASPGGGADAGAVVVFSGRTRSYLYRVDGTAPNEGMGWTVAPAGQVAGRPAFLVGVPAVQAGGIADAGRVLLLDGTDGTVMNRYDGVGRNDSFGAAVAAAGFEGSGIPALLIGAPDASPNGMSGAGIADLLSLDGTLQDRFAGANRSADLGWAVAPLSCAGAGGFLIGTPLSSLEGLPDAGEVLAVCGLGAGEIRFLLSLQVGALVLQRVHIRIPTDGICVPSPCTRAGTRHGENA